MYRSRDPARVAVLCFRRAASDSRETALSLPRRVDGGHRVPSRLRACTSHPIWRARHQTVRCDRIPRAVHGKRCKRSHRSHVWRRNLVPLVGETDAQVYRLKSWRVVIVKEIAARSGAATDTCSTGHRSLPLSVMRVCYRFRGDCFKCRLYPLPRRARASCRFPRLAAHVQNEPVQRGGASEDCSGACPA